MQTNNFTGLKIGTHNTQHDLEPVICSMDANKTSGAADAGEGQLDFRFERRAEGSNELLENGQLLIAETPETKSMNTFKMSKLIPGIGQANVICQKSENTAETGNLYEMIARIGENARVMIIFKENSSDITIQIEEKTFTVDTTGKLKGNIEMETNED